MRSYVSINLKSLIKARVMTLRELSKITGITPQQLSAINRAKPKKIEFNTIYKLLNGLACTPNDLFLIQNTNESEAEKVQSQ